MNSIEWKIKFEKMYDEFINAINLAGDVADLDEFKEEWINDWIYELGDEMQLDASRNFFSGSVKFKEEDISNLIKKIGLQIEENIAFNIEHGMNNWF